MKVYIQVDSEGQACVTREPSATSVYGTFQAEYNRLRATEETTAAIEGARQGGATDVLVHDAGMIRGWSPGGLMLFYDDLPAGIRIAVGGASRKRVFAEGFDAAMLIGKHARAGVPDGVMAHTSSSASIEGMFLNGRAIGEIGLEAIRLGARGIPLVMVAADEAGCREARDWLGDVEVAPVKKGLGTHWAISLHPADADELIRAPRQRMEGLA